MPSDGYTEFTPETITSPDGINNLNRILRTLYDNVAGDTEGVRVFSGYGTPEGVVTAGIGSMYMRLDGGANTSVYRKESGTGNTGWVANTNVTLPLSVANGGTGADNSGALQGTILYFSATGVLSVLATGVSGQYLKTQGVGANPTWATITMPVGLDIGSTTTISGAATTGNISLTNGKIYFVEFNFKNFTSASNLRLRFNADSGANYKYINDGATTTGTISSSSASASFIQIGRDVASAATQGIMGSFFIQQVGTSSQIYRIWGQCAVDDNTSSLFAMLNFSGTWSNSANVTNFSIFPSGGNMDGTVYLYELKTS
jgi:hypothetical protein